MVGVESSHCEVNVTLKQINNKHDTTRITPCSIINIVRAFSLYFSSGYRFFSGVSKFININVVIVVWPYRVCIESESVPMIFISQTENRPDGILSPQPEA